MPLSPNNELVLSRAELAVAATPETGRIPRLDRPSDGRAVIWYHPDWRFRQASLYYQAWNSSRARGITWRIPDWENDDLVENLFVFLVSGTCSSRRWRDVLSMTFQIYDHNEMHGLGSRIKAYTVAGLIPDEIADKFSLDVDAVNGFLSVFFDVKESLSSRDKLATMVFGFAQEMERGASVAARREASWIATAFLGGVDILDTCTGIKSDQDEVQFEQTAKFVFSQMGAKAAEAAAHLRMGDSVPKKSHLEFFLEMNEVQSRILSAQAQMASVEEERSKDEGHKKMVDFISAIGSSSETEDFLIGSSGSEGEKISLDSLRTDDGRKRVEKLLGLESPEEKRERVEKKKAGPQLLGSIRKAS